MKNSLLLACLIFFSLNCVKSHADEKELICIDGSEKAVNLGLTLRKMNRNSKETNSNGSSFSPALRITSDIILRPRLGNIEDEHYEKREEVKSGSTSSCSMEIQYRYLGNGTKDIVLKSGLTMSVKDSENIFIGTWHDGLSARNYISFNDQNKKIMISLLIDVGCTTKEIIQLANKSGKIQLNLITPRNALECQKKNIDQQKETLEISELEKSNTIRHSRPV